MDHVLCVRNAQAGCDESFVDLVEHYRAAMIGTAYSYLHNIHDVEDAVQSAILRAYIHLPTLREPDKFGPWILRITRNACCESLRQRKPSLSIEDGRANPMSGDVPGLVVGRLEIREALDCLGEDTRITVVLAYIYGYSHAEVAELLQVPLNTVRSRLMNAKRRLTESLGVTRLEIQSIKPTVVVERSRIMKIIEHGSEDRFWTSAAATLGTENDGGITARMIRLDDTVVLSAFHMTTVVFMREVGIDDPSVIGWCAAAAAVAKLAAAGGTPIASQIALSVNPWQQDSSYVEQLCAGAKDAAGQWQSQSPAFTLAIGRGDVTIAVDQLGTPGPRGPVPARSGQVGDVILVTNTLGDAIVAIEALKKGLYQSEEEKQVLINQNIRIQPRVNEALAAWGSGLSSSLRLAYRGLTTDLQYLCRANDYGAKILVDHLPMSEQMRHWAQRLDLDPVFVAASGNEDYELIITCAQENVAALTDQLTAFGSRVSVVGELVAERGVFLEYPDGTTKPEPSEWRHF